MRQWAEEQPEMFDGATLEEASGYIPTRKQAKDPRFVMALTRDVRPGAVGKEANKLGLETDSQGHPALLTAGLQKLLREFKEQDLFEINMGGKNLRKEAAKTGALAGMEFEMVVPDTENDDDGGDQEPDWDQDEQASSPSDFRDFFYDGDFNSRRDVDRLIDSMMEAYSEWQSEEFGNRWDGDAEEFIYQYIKKCFDFTFLISQWQKHSASYTDTAVNSEKTKYKAWANNQFVALNETKDVSKKFLGWIDLQFSANNVDYPGLAVKINGA
jgi:hypothetical protein